MIDRNLSYGRDHIRRFLREAGGDDILDLGAGMGSDLDAARALNPGARLHAVEVNPPYADALRAKGVLVHEIDLERDRMPLSDVSIDVVMANQVLEHVKEIFWILHEASRVLRIGGHLIIGVPNLASLHNRLLLLMGRQPTVIQNHTAHVRGYTRRDLLRTLERPFPGGYKLRTTGGSNFYPFPPLLARPLAAVFPSAAWGMFLLLRKSRAYQREYLDFPGREKLETNFFVG
jgi:SAM-dependent methyltransferase